jgi:hypothetical protein
MSNREDFGFCPKRSTPAPGPVIPLGHAQRDAWDAIRAAYKIADTPSNFEQFSIFMIALEIHSERNARYRDVWRVTGWRGALYDLYKKATRLFRQYWRGTATPGADVDDAYDLINFAAFFLRGRDEENEWGIEL